MATKNDDSAQRPDANTKYPPNWSKMTAGEKRAWVAKNTNARPLTPPAAPAPAKREAPVTEELPGDDIPEEQQPGDDQGDDQGAGEAARELTLTVTFPGEESKALTGREAIARILRALADSMSY